MKTSPKLDPRVEERKAKAAEIDLKPLLVHVRKHNRLEQAVEESKAYIARIEEEVREGMKTLDVTDGKALSEIGIKRMSVEFGPKKIEELEGQIPGVNDKIMAEIQKICELLYPIASTEQDALVEDVLACFAGRYNDDEWNSLKTFIAKIPHLDPIRRQISNLTRSWNAVWQAQETIDLVERVQRTGYFLKA